MVESFISKAGQGKSTCMLIEAAQQTGKHVAFISLEMSERQIMKRLKCINPTTKSFVVFTPVGEYKTINSWLYKKVTQLSEDFDIICVDAIDLASSGPTFYSKADLEKINDACFKGFMTQCESLWVSKNVYQKMEFDEDYLDNPMSIESFEIKGLLKVKQVCRRIEHPLLPGTYSNEAVDLITKEVKMYNFNKLFKN